MSVNSTRLLPGICEAYVGNRPDVKPAPLPVLVSEEEEVALSTRAEYTHTEAGNDFVEVVLLNFVCFQGQDRAVG